MGLLTEIVETRGEHQAGQPVDQPGAGQNLQPSAQPERDGGAGATAIGIVPAGHSGFAALPSPPVARCSVCYSPAGRHFWLDFYGEWNCTTCRPPASLSQVRAEWLVPLAGESECDGGPQGDLSESSSLGDPPIDPWEPVPGFRIMAVLPPDGEGPPIWNPNTSQQEWQEVLEGDEFFRVSDRLRAEGRIGR